MWPLYTQELESRNDELMSDRITQASFLEKLLGKIHIMNQEKIQWGQLKKQLVDEKNMITDKLRKQDELLLKTREQHQNVLKQLENGEVCDFFFPDDISTLRSQSHA